MRSARSLSQEVTSVEAPMQPIWIEAALNGPWGRDRQPGAPVAVEEIVADARAAFDAGAAIIHVHAYDVVTGRQRDDWEIYARIIEGVRARCDAVVYPTLPLSGSDYAASAAARFAHVEELARRGLIEWTVIDPGSVNFLRFDQIDAPKRGFVYANPPDEVAHGLALAARARLHPGFAIYEPGFTRAGAALARAAGCPTPIYRFMFSDEFAWGAPPRATYLDAHLALLAECAPGAPWMVAGLGVDIRPLIGAAVQRGGHVRVGLEDAPWGSAIGNRQWVEAARRAIEAAGATTATPADVRRALAAPPAQDASAFDALKARLDSDLAAHRGDVPLRLGARLFAEFHARGLLEERVFKTAHPPLLTAIHPTYADRAVQRDDTLAPGAYAFGKSAPRGA